MREPYGLVPCSPLVSLSTLLFPPLCGLLLEVCDALMAGGSSGMTVSSQVLQCRGLDRTVLQEGLHVVLVAFPLSPGRPTAFLKLAVENLTGEPLGRHANYMPKPAQMPLCEEHLDAGCLGPVIDVHIWDSVLPGQTQDALEAADVISLQDSDMPLVGRPGFLRRNCQVSVQEDPGFEPTKGRRG